MATGKIGVDRRAFLLYSPRLVDEVYITLYLHLRLRDGDAGTNERRHFPR